MLQLRNLVVLTVLSTLREDILTEHDITAMDPEYWEGALQNNLRTLFNPVRCLVPILEKQGGGCIITISAGERVRQDANAAYAAAKSGMVATAKNLAKELYDKNIRVHALCPGIIWDPLPEGKIAQSQRN